MTNCRQTPAIESVSKRTSGSKRIVFRAVKRFSDIVLSLLALTVLALPMLVIAVIIKADSPGPALFRQHRVGRNGRLFRICKFRTMYTSAPSETATCELEHAYSYITRFGVFLRKTSLDELPQLFNVLAGDMSIIGPRPLILGDGDIHTLRKQANVYSARPGITGWAQVNGRDCIDNERKVALDAEYVENMSALFDLRILLLTVAVVFSGDGFAEGCQPDANSASDPTEVKESVGIDVSAA